MKRFYVLGIIFLFVFPLHTHAKKPAIYIGEVTSFKLNIRNGPSQSADVITAVDRGTRVEIVEKKGGIGTWLVVRYKGSKGYVRNRPHYIKLLPVPPKKKIS
ncbi:MAG: SH3 domain-containing protein, partial [Desulfobacteraceae bacterium]|nr:SH3 domain-containing protein [Desulfobacteraceae bacterium]